MKQLRFEIVLSACVAAALAIPASAAGTRGMVATPPRVVLNDQAIQFRDQQPVQRQGRVYVPLRGVLEEIGTETIEWRPERREVFIARDGRELRLQIGRRRAWVDGSPVSLDTPPILVGGRTLVPLRFVSERLGANVHWEAATRTAYVSTPAERIAGLQETLPVDRDGDPAAAPPLTPEPGAIDKPKPADGVAVRPPDTPLPVPAPAEAATPAPTDPLTPAPVETPAPGAPDPEERTEIAQVEIDPRVEPGTRPAGTPLPRLRVAQPFPNFLGTTGLLYTPSAYTSGDRSWGAHFHGNSDIVGGGILGGGGDRVELGLSVVDASNADRSWFNRSGTRVLVNGKLNLVGESRGRPALALGVMDAASQLKGDPSWYAVASKTIRRVDPGEGGALIAHLGYGDGIFREDLFGGGEFFFSPTTSALAEYHGGKVNLGVRGQLGGLSGTIGLFDTKHLGAGLRFNVPFR